MKHDNDPPCYYEAKAWAEEQEAGDAVAAFLLAFFTLAGLLGYALLY
jgi:hypothetical protein